MARRSVPDTVITGLGLITAYGWGTDAYWSGLLSGSRALRPHADLAAAGFDRTVTAALDDAHLAVTAHDAYLAVTAHDAHRLHSRRSRLARAATAQALREASLTGLGPGTLVVTVGQTPLADEADDSREGTPTRGGREEFAGPSPADLPGVSPRAETVYLSQACASVSFALDYVRTWLRSGCGTTALVVGTCVLNAYEYAGMAITGALSPTGARPFDTARDGTSLGEGAGAILLETAAAAEQRGITPQAVLAGAAARVNGRSPAASDEAAITDCVLAALEDAGLERVGYIHAHATGTVQGDTVELAALGAVGAPRGWVAVPVSGHKGGIGHLMHASSAPGIAAALGFLRTGTAPGTPGLDSPEAAGRAIDVLTAPRRLPGAPRSCLVNSFGFAGNNSSLVLTAPDGSTR
ncbi:3-oxoacyl-ACP synthase [Streptomyces lunaelactis]|uniref:beta-ketoacyl synthase N-terminal-like domain-containing protein n=1 Tax=Streptomyces lunaelactis TaxID=1535768 RepID=UPI0015856DD1|nr:beta-ketoacyl synthase N-terminal-like domain-containing protein [Streptomyces lunaelactis]NUL28768.1 3-oxoacyl-ACP synthase [Streptomyces lunaelactis]